MMKLFIRVEDQLETRTLTEALLVSLYLYILYMDWQNLYRISSGPASLVPWLATQVSRKPKVLNAKGDFEAVARNLAVIAVHWVVLAITIIN